MVTQRAPQLYAQSLRGDTKADAGHSKTPATAAQGANLSALPWWVTLPIGGAITAGTFWAGTVWASRYSRRLQPAAQGSLSPRDTEIYFHSNGHGNGSADGKVHTPPETLEAERKPHQN